jgi:UMF1 family MFS transporter
VTPKDPETGPGQGHPPSRSEVLPTEAGPRPEVFGWMMYAWAFHGFVTTVATVLFGPYLTDLAQQAVGENGRVFALSLLGTVTAKSFFFLCVSLSVLLQLFLLPLLGAIADYSHAKKRILVLTGYIGAGATCLLFFVGAGLDFRWGGLLFIVANLSLGATTVLYNAFLPEIVPPDQRDRVSSRGYALGYLGGGLLLAANLVFMRFAPDLGIPRGRAVRLSLLSAGLWWVGFSLITFRRLRARAAARARPLGRSYLAVALSELRGTFRELSRLPRTRSYLIAYLFFNDGIQTVISVAAVFFAQELFVARGREVDEAFLLGLMLMVQFVGFGGALFFERIAAFSGAKSALLLALAIWSGVVVYAYAAFQTEAQAWGMAAVIAVVLGGSQALSRSLFSCMIPPQREASFFGLYEIANSGTSWIGPFIFALVVSGTNSYRQALLSLITLFAVGFLLLVVTDTDRAIREAGQA